MNKADFTDLLKNPEKLGTEHIETLRKIVADFPFFSTAHVLLAKALANTNHYEYEKQLKITALLTGDRSVLYQFITGNKDQEGDIEAFNVPLELKVEKVSKPDFEITAEEAQEAALLNEANNILEEAETNSYNEAKIVESEISDVEENESFDTVEEIRTEQTSEPELRGGRVLDADEATTNTDEIVNDSAPVIEQEETVAEEENTRVPEENSNETKEVEETAAVENYQKIAHEFVEEVLEEESKQPEEIVDEVQEKTHQEILEPVQSVEEEEAAVVEEDDSHDISSENEQLQDEDLVPVELNNNTKEKVHQLAETEGTLVRFRGNFSEEILQDFDETSLEDNKENIETVTKFVTSVIQKEELANPEPVQEHEQNDLPETKVEETPEGDGIFSDNIIEPEATVERQTDVEEPTLYTESDTEEAEQPEAKEQPVFAVEPVVPVSLDQLLEKYNDEQDEEDAGVGDEQVAENEPDEDLEHQEIEEKPEILVEDGIAETTETLHSEYNTGNEGGLNFIDWLNKNKAETNQNAENKVEAKAKTSIEDDEFTLYIQHLIKAKAESTLAKNIEAETQFEKAEPHEEKEEHVAENIVAAIELPDVDPRLIEEEEEEEVEQVKDITPVIEPFIVETTTITTFDKIGNDEDSTFEEIEAFEVNSTKEEEVKEEKEALADTVAPPFIDEIYSGKVESILPDFEKLNAQSNEHAQPESFFTFDETKDFVAVGNEIDSNADDEPETNETVSFEPAALNEDLFDSLFIQAFPTGGKRLTGSDNQQKEPAIKSSQPKMEVESILEKFMRENPSITRPKAEFFNPINVAKLSVEEKDEIVSETLASIYLKQGLVKKAISTYEKLSLIYPHKIAYFAALIKQLKTEHNIN